VSAGRRTPAVFFSPASRLNAMTTYNAPLRDMNFVLNELAGLVAVAALPGLEDSGPDTVEAILEGAAAFTSEVLAPLNHKGDTIGCSWKDGEVTTPPGFKEAYAEFTAGGWNGLAFPEQFAGQGTRGSRCFWRRNSWSTMTARSGVATTCAAPPSSTRWASTRARRP
jgi:alkylation response protein AidB-like acyl-CoA dehydrogenase